MTEKSFFDIVPEIKEMAREKDQVCYLYSIHQGSYTASVHHWDDWLFKAYPGGRMILSARGAEIAKENGWAGK